MCNHFMYHPSFAIPRMNIHGDLSSHHSYLIAQSDGHLIKGTEGFVFHDIPEDIARFESCRIFLGTWNGISWWVIGIRLDLPLQTAYSLLTLREIPNGTNSPISGIACRAVQLVRFFTLTKYCGYCGSRTYIKTDEVAKICTSCKKIVFPKLSPAVIVRITDGSRILLSRSPHFPKNMYSVQAGFVEAGESLETAVCREVREEIGIEISNIKYFGSQPWPFPDSLMIGFTAEYAGGEIMPDGFEIEDAGWYTHENLPQLPGPDSIASALILSWIEQIAPY